MKNIFAASFSGALFAIGLLISGMTQPSKVQAFLDIFGDWDPSLAFVMGGAIALNLFLFRIILKREHPLFSATFDLSSNQVIDRKLVVGSALFGVGWALGGYCPGPSFTALLSGDIRVFVFVVSMALGMFAFSKSTLLRPWI